MSNNYNYNNNKKSSGGIFNVLLKLLGVATVATVSAAASAEVAHRAKEVQTREKAQQKALEENNNGDDE